MIIKKYQANNEADAIILAKEELGSNVIIMNVRKITPKGLARIFKKSKVEITAAVDDEKSYEKAEEKTKEKLKEELVKAKNEKESTKNKEIESKLDSIQTLLEKKIDRLEEAEKHIVKKSLEDNEDKISTQSSKENRTSKAEDKKEVEKKESTRDEDTDNEGKDSENLGKSEKCVRLIKKQMLKHEVDEKYIDVIINEVKGNIKKDALVDNILTSIYQKIILKLGQPKLIEPGNNHPKYIFFMGPTGVGKTTTIAKIASDFKLNRKLNVALLTADTYRIAAVEQLRIYANILKIPLNVVYSPEEIEKLKGELDRYDIVLIDTAGRSHKNREQRDDLRELINSIDEKERDAYLVLSATTKYSDLVNIVESYSDIKDYKLLFTKIDETTSVGNILNIKMLTNAQLSYIACGQDVPTDIGKLDAQDIAKQLLGGDM